MADLRYLSKVLQRLNQMSALFLNSLLLYLVKNYTRKLGNFKTFINISAFINVYICFLLAILNPQFFTFNSTFGYFAQSFIESRYFTALFCVSFSLPFSFVVIHILYRYWTVTKPERRAWFKQAWFISLLALYVAIDASFCYFRNILFTPSHRTGAFDFAHDFFESNYNITVEDGFIVVQYWQNGHLNLQAICFLLSVVSRFLVELIFCVARVHARRTHVHISESTSISEGHRVMQFKFLQAIVVQMFIPVISVYTPLLLILISPLLSLPSYTLSSIFPALVSCYPVWDAAAVIMIIKDYREGVYTIFTGKTVRNNEISGFTNGATGAFSKRTRSAATVSRPALLTSQSTSSRSA